MKVLNFGALNIDYVYKVDHFVNKGETISSESLNTFPGGKGLNQSVAFGRAEVEVYHAGMVGQEGTFLIEFLKSAGVNTEYISVHPELKSGHAIIQNNAEGDNSIILYGGTNQAITKALVDEVLGHFESGDYLVLQNEISELPYIMDRAKDKGMVIVLNPSPMDHKIASLPLHKVNYFILNEIEAKQILNKEYEDHQVMLESLHEKFPNAKIVLTLGEEGSMYYDGEKKHRQSSFKVKAVDTTAAGDTFTGYYLAGEIAGLSIEESMEHAAIASAIAVSRAGAGVSIPNMDEVIAFKSKRAN